MLYHFETEQWVPAATEEVFRFFANPENLPRIMPPASSTKVLGINIVPPVQADPQNARVVAGAGSEVITSFRMIPYLPFRGKWTARITAFEWNSSFTDVQQQGPFKSFHHRHEVKPETRQAHIGTVVKDIIDYEIGFGPLDAVANLFVSRQLRKTFQYRQAALQKILVPSR